MSNNQALTLVTGASGYLAGHCIEVLLKHGYKVRGTVRSLKNKEKYDHLLKLPNSQNLELVEANLTDKEAWSQIVKQCEYILHTASPFPLAPPKNPDDVIKPAVEGTENVIKSAIAESSVKKVVLTSSLAAIFPGNDQDFFTNKDWSNPKKSTPYEASKHLAEKKAWELIKQNQQQGGKLALTVINPGFIQGPCHSSKNTFTSGDFIKNMMTNNIPGLAKVSMPLVDVREVALAHLRALENPKSDGKRYVLAENTYWFEDISNLLVKEFSQFGYKIPTRIFGSCTLSFVALFNDEAKAIKHLYGRYLQFDNSETIADLDIQFRNGRETLLDTAYDLIDKGIVPNKLPKNHERTHNTTVFKN